ncbi:MAG: ATP-binding cassette domain-containing protein [Hydrotalea flava]|uniref:ABC transporter ATP-binding protein n=1 Tax=Hydrotalea TaxID=1004300 RepID=UPI0009453500|nr:MULTISPECIES: ATP-binding cassette domain-containing protein [Hydrotalea]MBY0348404.1 ATP-binding cassette domain-containing protein [Hydrotalea flava]RWZ87604.1 MAG: ATP-binding cassette domain-containing protein [Hydrotalea sp. AMD]
MIQLEQVTKVFNPGRVNEVMALNNVSLNIQQGEFVIIIGANGSGKTTLFNTIAGAVIPTKGKVWIAGEEVTTLPDYKRSKWIARVFQNPFDGTAPDLTILDNFRLAALRTQSKPLKIGINTAFKRSVQNTIARLGMGLENKLNQPMGTLSGGQRQALTLLMSIMDTTTVLLLDEPTAALDPKSADIILKVAQSLIKEYQLTAIFITHNLKDAQQYGNRLLQIHEGKLVRDLNAAEKHKLLLQNMYEWFG